MASLALMLHTIANKYHKQMKQGFTLLELSIVLVIIGLIIGGITAGSSLIRSAELNSVISDVNKYKVAFGTFKLKYNALPGDIDNASAYWPTECVAQGTRLCDGNGDESIATHAASYEPIRFWQHLALAGLIDGSYTGFRNGRIEITDETLPAAPIDGASFSITTGSVYSSPAQSNNRLTLNGNDGCNIYNNTGILTGTEALSIDRKIDDGSADSGKAYSSKGHSTSGCAVVLSGCTDNEKTNPTGTYDLTSDEPSCRMWFDL